MRTKNPQSKQQTIVHYDAPDDRASFNLRRKANGDYVLETEKLLRKRGEKWVESPMTGNPHGWPMRWRTTKRQITEGEAINWYVANVVPEPLRAVISELIGEVVTVNLGVKLMRRLDRYCKDHGVSRQSVFTRAIMENVRFSRAADMESAIVYLQRLLVRRFGTEIKTASGAGTIYISHDAVSMTGKTNEIVAHRPGSIARVLADAARSATR